MNFLSKLKNLVTRGSYGPSNDFWYNPISAPTTAGADVSEQNALTYLTVFACVSLIAGDLARLPLILYKRRKDGGKERATGHPLYDILHNVPNSETDSFHWREMGQGQCLLWGNHFSFIERDGLGRVKGLWQLLNPGQIELKRLRGRLVYAYKNAEGKEVIREKDKIFHVAGFGSNGLYGKSMISLAREAIGMGLAIEKFGSRYFGEGTHPAGTLEMDGYLGEKREEYVAAFRKGYAGLGKSHSVMMLEGGAKYKPMTIPMEDAQFLETRQHQRLEICGMYHVPPHKIAIHGSNSNYNNLEQENASYVDSCLMHWLVRWESAISTQLLTAKERSGGLFAEFLVDGLLRGDSAARSDFYSKMVANGAMSPNDIRKKENLDPIDGGDQYFIPLNYVSLEQAGQLAEIKPEKPEEQKKTEEKTLRNVHKKEERSVAVRDRIADRYYPLLLDAFQTVVNKESKSIKNQVTARAARRDNSSFTGWLDSFYDDFGGYVRQKTGPVLKSFLEAVRDETVREIGVNINDNETNDFINDYINGYATRHVSSSKGQLIALNRDEGEEEIVRRADEWYEKRAGKEATNEKVRAASAIFQTVAFAAGLSTYWRIRGAKTCAYCTMLDGKKVNRGQSFVADGDKLKPEGQESMKIRGMKAHPPLHANCDCSLVVRL